MEQTLSENLQLGQLVANALGEIERLGYSRRSRNRYRAIWEHLIEFSLLAESLLAAQITFAGLNRCVSKQELNLLKFSSR